MACCSSHQGDADQREEGAVDHLHSSSSSWLSVLLSVQSHCYAGCKPPRQPTAGLTHCRRQQELQLRELRYLLSCGATLAGADCFAHLCLWAVEGQEALPACCCVLNVGHEQAQERQTTRQTL